MKYKTRKRRMYSEAPHPGMLGLDIRKKKEITFTDYYIIWSIWSRPCYMKFFSILGVEVRNKVGLVR